MAIFKRFEVWLLLVLCIAGAGYVLWSDSQPDGNGGSVPAGPGSEPPDERKRFEVRRVRTVSEGDDRIIEIELLGRNETDETQELKPPEVRLMAKYEGDEEESEIPSFFLPFDPPPALEPKGESVVTLKYWLEPKFGKPDPLLRLEALGESIALSLPAGEGDEFDDNGGKFGGAQGYQF